MTDRKADIIIAAGLLRRSDLDAVDLDAGVQATAKPLVGWFEELLNSLNKATEATGEVQDDPPKHNLKLIQGVGRLKYSLIDASQTATVLINLMPKKIPWLCHGFSRSDIGWTMPYVDIRLKCNGSS